MSDIQNAPNPRSSTLNRVLLGVVILLGILIVAALLTLVYGFVAGWNKASTTPAAPVADASSSTLQKLPPGAQIIDMKVDNGRTVVRLKTAKGEEIDIYDTATGKLITRIAPEP